MSRPIPKVMLKLEVKLVEGKGKGKSRRFTRVEERGQGKRVANPILARICFLTVKT